MSSAFDPGISPCAAAPDPGVPQWRLHLLRAMYLVWVLAGFFMALPPLFSHEPSARGMLPSMMAGLWVTGFLGLRYPLLMLPIFLFEFAWKSIWLAAFGIPQWVSGTGSPRLAEDLAAIGTGPILFAIVIPWGYVYRNYWQEPSTRWRKQPLRTP